MLNKDKIKEEDYLDRFQEVATGLGLSKLIANKIANFIHYEIQTSKSHLSAQYEKLIEECLPEKKEEPNTLFVYSNDIAYNEGLFIGWNSVLSRIRASLQERGIKIK